MLSFRPLRRGLLLLGLALAGIQACVEPYNPSLTLSADVLIVEGTLTDLPETQFVKLSRSRVYGKTSATTPVTAARVEVVVGGTQSLSLRETPGGVYLLPGDFRAKVGERYQLRFRVGDNAYESSVETMRTGSVIGKVYDSFDARGIPNAARDRFIPAHLIYLDTQDPPGERNFYRWSWTLWEAQAWCASCQQGRFLTNNPITNDGTCLTDSRLPRDNFFDYGCATRCWDIFQSFDLNLFSDVYSNGNPIRGRLVAKIPYYQIQPALVEIRQYALTAGAYRYFKLFEDQTQSTGGLADTPPAPIVGNVRSLSNDQEPIVGYFSASPVSTVRYWLDRRNASGPAVGLFQTLFGREAIPEPTAILPPPLGFRPPSARCLPSDTRTPVQPEGWR